MRIITLAPIPNQSFSIRLDDERYMLVFKETAGVMSCDISRNNVQLLSGQRIVAGSPLIPYRYQIKGNFIFLTENEELPEYSKFGSTQTLIYASIAELEAI